MCKAQKKNELDLLEQGYWINYYRRRLEWYKVEENKEEETTE